MDNDSFFTIDRLVEFGMSLAVSQQMIQMMNQSMQSMYVPGTTMPASLPNIIYAVIDGESVGPMTEAEVIRLISNKQITKDTYVWKPGMENWQKMESAPEVLKLVLLAPPMFNK
ncbi:MAG: DUF4339 domain-containing protein [Bacteroidales bacterium]|nr:DUF4339 domain-containing protein [Bacteroidales bacterium]